MQLNEITQVAIISGDLTPAARESKREYRQSLPPSASRLAGCRGGGGRLPRRLQRVVMPNNVHVIL